MTENASAVFFDRDGTLIADVPYNGDPAKVRLRRGAAECLKKLKKAGFLLFLISNQSGVGRGMITKADVDAVNKEMLRRLGGDFFKDIYICYDAPGKDGGRRKPSPAMLEEAARDHGVDLKRSFMAGDKFCDVECAKRAGCKSILILGGGDDEDDEENVAARHRADFVSEDLDRAAEWIIKIRSQEPEFRIQ